MKPATAGPVRAIVLHPDLAKGAAKDKDGSRRDPAGALAEAVGLALAIDLALIATEIVKTNRMRSATLFGRGVVDRVHDLVRDREIEVAIINCALTPVQQRNLEEAWHCKVIDRTALILEIFGARARTHEGRLQVELAALTFQRSRLVRSWTHLERQRGGGGFIGGPGERQIELDRRLIDERIARLKRALEKVTRTRGLHRAARQRTPWPIVAFVGYTNAGKSTLFNRLSHSEVAAKDMLFATLDPTMRRLVPPSGRTVIVSDTVGFISDLPTHLVAAFRATLEEVLAADLLVHVRDISHPESEDQRRDVEAVLSDLGLDEAARRDRVIEVWNKLDLIDPADRAALQAVQRPSTVALSALTGEGCAALVERIDSMLAASLVARCYRLDVGAGAARAWLHRHGQVRGESADEDCVLIPVLLSAADAGRFEERFGATPEPVDVPSAPGGLKQA